MNLILNTDAACEPNPGGVGTYGWVLADLYGCEHSGSGVSGDGPGTTNNTAEYAAVVKALEYVAANAPPDGFRDGDALTVRSDSKLVVNQINGTWKCNGPELVKLRDRCRELAEALKPLAVRFEWVSRDENAKADELTQTAYTQHTGRPFPVRSHLHHRPKAYGRK